MDVGKVKTDLQHQKELLEELNHLVDRAIPEYGIRGKSPLTALHLV